MMKPQTRWRHALLLMAAGWCSVSLYSTDIEFNNRETCRKEVAGVYLTVYDAWVQARDFALSLEKTQKEDLAHLQRIEAQIAKTKPEAAEFNLSQRYEQETQAKSRTQLLTALAEAQHLHTAAKNREVAAQGQVTILTTALSRIFIQAESPLPRDGYPFRWMYRETCPKFRDNCPLSQAAAAQLTTLFSAIPTQPEDAVRYPSSPATFGRVGDPLQSWEMPIRPRRPGHDGRDIFIGNGYTEYPLPESCAAYARFSMTSDSETAVPTATFLHP